MSTLAFNIGVPSAISVSITDDTLTVELNDGRSVSIPISWYPRLLNATEEERNIWRFVGGGHGIHWEKLDEDISIENLLVGRRSRESQESLRRWLNSR